MKIVTHFLKRSLFLGADVLVRLRIISTIRLKDIDVSIYLKRTILAPFFDKFAHFERNFVLKIIRFWEYYFSFHCPGRDTTCESVPVLLALKSDSIWLFRASGQKCGIIQRSE